MIPFLAIHAKGGESMSPKQKDRTTTYFSKTKDFQLVSHCVHQGERVILRSPGGESNFSKINMTKPSSTLRGEFHLGGVLFSQRKSI
jgi:hypothetical protein